MSKAFTKESDQDQSAILPPRIPLPPGVKNYITPGGAQRLRDELIALSGRTIADPAESLKRDARTLQLQEIIASLVIAEIPPDREIARFGASVTVQREKEKAPETYRLVGVDETNLDLNEISWLSPLGKSLLGKRAGDRVRFRSPSGTEEITVLSLSYS